MERETKIKDLIDFEWFRTEEAVKKTFQLKRKTKKRELEQFGWKKLVTLTQHFIQFIQKAAPANEINWAVRVCFVSFIS